MEELDKIQEVIHEHKREIIFYLLFSLISGGMLFFYKSLRSDKFLWFFLIISISYFFYNSYKTNKLKNGKITKDELRSSLMQIRKGLILRSALGGFLIGIAYAYWKSFKMLEIVTIDAYLPLIVFLIAGTILIFTNYFFISCES